MGARRDDAFCLDGASRAVDFGARPLFFAAPAAPRVALAGAPPRCFCDRCVAAAFDDADLRLLELLPSFGCAVFVGFFAAPLVALTVFAGGAAAGLLAGWARRRFAFDALSVLSLAWRGLVTLLATFFLGTAIGHSASAAAQMASAMPAAPITTPSGCSSSIARWASMPSTSFERLASL